MIIYPKPKLKKEIIKVFPTDECFKDVLTFYDILSKTNHNLDNFFIKVNKLQLVYDNINENAEYYFKKNILVYNPDGSKLYLFHELLHMITTISLKKRLYVGFFQYNRTNNTYIGDGLNEGYTELLTFRYFKDFYNSKYHDNELYAVSKVLVQYIEEILGQFFFEECYFTSDLKTVVDTLDLYIDNKKTIKFIESLDIINHSLEGDMYYSHEYGLNAYYNAVNYIYNLYLGYYEYYYKHNEIDKITYGKYVDNLYDSLREDLNFIVNDKTIDVGKYLKKSC